MKGQVTFGLFITMEAARLTFLQCESHVFATRDSRIYRAQGEMSPRCFHTLPILSTCSWYIYIICSDVPHNHSLHWQVDISILKKKVDTHSRNKEEQCACLCVLTKLILSYNLITSITRLTFQQEQTDPSIWICHNIMIYDINVLILSK